MTDNNIRFYAATLGCKINQYETQALREVWLERGFTEVDSAEAADIILVNSCAVTAKAVSDVRSTVRQANRANPDALIVVTGCAAQVMAEELSALPGVARVVPQEAKASLKRWPDLSGEPVADEQESALATEAPDDGDGQRTGAQEDVSFPDMQVSDYTRARAVVKVQDGCSHRCTYCIVPLTRGPSRSRAPHDIVAEAERLLEGGFRELILSGVNLRQYGRDLAMPLDFWDVVARLGKELAPRWAGKARLRISSLEPGQLGDKALETLAANPLLSPQLHLSLQSGSPTVLKRMGRGHYKPQPLLGFLQQLRDIWPVYGLGADILMGFPGETEQEFEETLAFCKELPLTYAHVFPYSRRPGTAAADMKDQLSVAVKKARAAAIRAVAAEKKEAFLQSLLTHDTVHVVLQSSSPAKGVSEFYTDCRFDSQPENATLREIVGARPVSVRKGTLIVTPCS
ncbi:tRNA (N(6)-L-threonylcarbamoyladenosine(37)-C(2))-methylthiotransferase MtaB [Oleidesulfovibrio sp.]|uniref:tRNA (N(6)-L-threonylcarbamoyladenosine(37)-C(2))- methylthiotransferase MtaB n=1 Tax=Oleidesulfovibrio sp. TaxID=2909707 RepID=UPI003A88EB5F